MKKKGILYGMAVLLFFLTVTLRMNSAYAAIEVDTGKKCAVNFQLDGTFQELETLEIPVDFYKVAQVTKAGTYEESEGFQELELDAVDSETTAAQWQEKALQAEKIIEENQVRPDLTAGVKTGAKDLETGLYLVAARQVQSAEYTYEFSPYLLSLPGSRYSEHNPDDTWLYEVTAGLKPEQIIRYGSLQIHKTLEAYNETFGGAYFIFSVEAVKDGDIVYSDVVSMNFQGPGTESIEIDRIPAGAQVTVTEIYSGSCYEVLGEPETTVEILADTAAQTTFTNTYDQENNGGSGIVNRFAYTDTPAGTWKYIPETDGEEPQE